jgi:hypothetical protein
MRTTDKSDDAAMTNPPRSMEELMTRMIAPIPGRLLSKKDSGGGDTVDFVNITTLKDLLDYIAGRGRWRVEILETLPTINTLYGARGKEPQPVMLFGMIVRLYIQTDEGWVWQDGTGTERLTGSKIYGDPLTNSYAQAVRRALESFGSCRELWRGQVITAQLLAQKLLTGHSADIPKATNSEEEEAVWDAEGQPQNEAARQIGIIHTDQPGSTQETWACEPETRERLEAAITEEDGLHQRGVKQALSKADIEQAALQEYGVAHLSELAEAQAQSLLERVEKHVAKIRRAQSRIAAVPDQPTTAGTRRAGGRP